MDSQVAEIVVARVKTTSTRLPADLVNMANVVASLQHRSAVEVLDDMLRGPLSKLYKQELAKATKAAEKEEK